MFEKLTFRKSANKKGLKKIRLNVQKLCDKF